VRKLDTKTSKKNGKKWKNSGKTRLFVRFWRQPKNRLKVAILVQNTQIFDLSVCLDFII
jgi:hypothetical protein